MNISLDKQSEFLKLSKSLGVPCDCKIIEILKSNMPTENQKKRKNYLDNRPKTH
jgi:hypothetical protein